MQSNSKYEITFPAGVSISGTPACSSNAPFIITVSSCTYSGSLLTINIGTVSSSLNAVTFTITNFVNPSSALDQWPQTGGFSIAYKNSANSLINDYGSSIKLQGFEATSLTSASITFNNSASNVVGNTAAIIKVTIQPATLLSTTGYISIKFPLEEVSGDQTCSTTGVTCTGDGTIFKSNPVC